MIDTHSHLFDDSFKEDIEECIQRCILANVNKIILVGFSHQTNELVQEYAKKYKLFYPTAGLHPSEANPNYKKDLDKLEVFLKEHKVYAIGECGLDYHYGRENIEEQKQLFRGQIELSIKKHLPLIIHMRDATQDTFDILKEYTGKVFGVMHCYSGSLEMAKEFIKLGFYISLGGPVTFKNAKESKKIAEGIDLNWLLVETDCPYLAPTPYRGQRNESSYVKNVVSEIAFLRDMTFDQVEKITEKNAIELFGLED
ncbi:MAG: TatD family hydrolase [Roseburia sp.]|nr:TatD family hydrolase [Anaeroplasma bactoclasticum]MCM1195539.1 TatD family hydrolase [Roseburia sp.]MCM1557790.1 TatD family hydrolase [Anaeroplasma bactoclasticum]